MLEQYHGVFCANMEWSIAGTILGILFLGFVSAPLIVWSVFLVAVAFGAGVPMVGVAALAGVLLFFNIPVLRQTIVSSPIMKLMKALEIMPYISETERTALEAGVVWAEADLFSGKPNFKKLMKEPYPQLTAEEKAFLDGPVEKFCLMVDDWKIWKTREIPNDAMQFLKDHRFFGMIIPKEYGGLGFTNLAHSEVIMKLSSRSIASAITVMVPNSLGPAELLIHYGTDEQRKKYLPRLARGEEMPCFGLTEAQAGSDAGSIASEGILFKGPDGKLYVRLNWKKRWITLAAISTVIGLAFKLKDPENLLGKGENLGITCALIPAQTKGVVIGLRHDPLGIPFYNCPTEGHDVVIEAQSFIIGGIASAGEGWKMLMECLGAGRGISLPAQSTGGVKFVTRVTTAHASIRKQFGLPIGRFEGVEEPLSRIAATCYYMEAMRRYTLSALDQGIKPPVITAISKFNATEEFRKCVNDGMDIMGGTGISMGPNNTLATAYIAAPIGITVEGANILTRTLMIFGQGALRAHPYAYKEVNAVEKGDVKGFDRAFWGHMGHIVSNMCRSLVLSFSRGLLAQRTMSGPGGRYIQKLNWISASFAIMADISMGVLGGKLKVKEKMTGRFADILSWMYIATATLRRFEAEGRKPEDVPFLHYSMGLALTKIQAAFDGIFANFDVPVIGWIFKGPIRWWSGLNAFSVDPSDKLSHKICELIMEDGPQRDRLTEGIFIPQDPKLGLGRLENAYHLAKKSEDVEKKIRKAVKEKKLAKKKKVHELIEDALREGVLSQGEAKTLKEAEVMRWEAIQVDEFNQEQYLNHNA